MAGELNENPIETIALEMPNGFHDSYLREFKVNYVDQVAEFIFDANMSDPEKKNVNIDNRRCRLLLSGLVFCSVETPRSLDRIKKGKGLWCDAGALEGDKLSRVFSGKLPEGAFAIWIFLDETNSFIHLAAKGASFEWMGKI